MISLGRLRGFVWVGRFRGYAEAARNFPYPITQPGLFQQVRKLEEELGLSLFVRIAKDQVDLTSAGRALFERVSPFLDELDAFEDELAAGRGGVLRVEASALVLRQLIPEWIRAIRRADASLDIRVCETGSADVARLLEGHADLLVDFFSGELPAPLDSVVVGHAHGYLVVPSRGGRKRAIDLGTLGDEEFIAYPKGTRHREIQDEALEQAGIVPRRVTEVGTADSMLALVSAGLGFALVPWIGRNGPDAKNTWAFRQKRADAVFPIRCVWRASSEGDSALETALQALSSPLPK